MTGGTVVVLGKTGRNFAAGMSGGVAYVYDEDGQFARRCNTAMVALEPLVAADQQPGDPAAWHNGLADEVQLKKLLEDHNRWTGSKRARELLDHWEASRGRFIKVFPTEYKRALDGIAARKAAAAAAKPARPPAPRPWPPAESPRTRQTQDQQHHGQSHRIHGIRAAGGGLSPGHRAAEELPGVRHRPRRRAREGAGRALHGLRHAVLQQRLPGQQHHSGFQRSGLPGRLAQRHHGAAQHQQLPGVHRSHLPGAVRGRLHAERQR
jgi:hypothetical protein